MGSVKVAKVISSKKGKYLVIQDFKFRFQKILADNKERWCCTDKKYKCCTKLNENRDILGGNELHNHDEDSEVCLNRYKLNNSVNRKTMVGFAKDLAD